MAKKKTKKREKNWRKFWKLGVDEFNTQFFGVNKDGELTATEGHHIYNLSDLAHKYGTPLQIVFPFIIEDRLKDLIGYFQAYIKIYGYKGKFFYHYPMKVNQNKEFILPLLSEGANLEATSANELWIVKKLWEREKFDSKIRVLCNGPKTDQYLDLIEELRGKGMNIVPIIESLEEVERLSKYKGDIGVRVDLNVRTDSHWDKMSKKLARPRVLIGVPSGTTNVETRAVYDAARSAGAREVLLVEEPMAAAIGIRLPIKDPVGSMIIDIGGGTTDIAVISLGGIVRSRNLKIAGDRLNNDIITYMRDEFKMLVGERTAEMVKIAIGSVIQGEYMETEVHGRDLLTGLPREVVVTDSDIREALSVSIKGLVEGVKDMLETTPPEILSDIMHRGITLSGGGALLPGLDQLLQRVLKIPVYVVEDPLSAVARGTGVILDNIPLYKDVLIGNHDELPPR